jgi:hypothetical protein
VETGRREHCSPGNGVGDYIFDNQNDQPALSLFFKKPAKSKSRFP